MEIKNFTKEIDKFILSLDSQTKPRVNQMLILLQESGNYLGMPFSKSLGEGLFELRISGKVQIRAIYCFYYGYIVLLNIFVKKQDKIPRKELDLAKKRRNMLA